MSSVAQHLSIDQLLDEIYSQLTVPKPNRSDLQADKTPQKILEQTLKASRVLSLFRIRYNESLPVNQLPAEVLQEIFAHTQDYQLSVFPPLAHHELAGKNAWLVLTKVCHYWRQLVFGTPSLWKTLVLGHDIKNHDAMKEWFLRLSKPFPVHLSQVLRRSDIGAFGPLPEMVASLREFLKNSNHITAIHISNVSLLGQHIWPILQDSLPNLTSVHFDFSQYNESPRTMGRLPIIFNGEPSRITRLSLSHVHFWPDNVATFENITHLALRNLRLRPHIQDFLDTLSSCPLLEVIYLENASPTSYIELPSHTPTQSLPLRFLRRLSIHDPPYSLDFANPLLKFVDLPATVEFTLSSPLMFDSRIRMNPILPPQSYLDKITKIDIRSSGDECLVIHKETAWIDTSRTSDGALLLIATYCSNTLHEITFSKPPQLPKGRVINLLRRFPELSVIRFESPTNYMPFVEALNEHEEEPLCPGLTELVVQNMGAATTLTPNLRRQVLQYQLAGITEIARPFVRRTYRLVVKPYDSAHPFIAHRLRRLLPQGAREHEF